MIRGWLCHSSVAVTRPRAQGGSLQESISLGVYSQLQRFNPLSSWHEAWRNVGSSWCCSWELYAVSRSREREIETCSAWHWLLKPQDPPPLTYFLQHVHIDSNKDTLLILLKLCHNLITKNWNIWACRGHSYSNHAHSNHGPIVLQSYNAKNTVNPTSKVPIV